jgi:hypothetical protein
MVPLVLEAVVDLSEIVHCRDEDEAYHQLRREAIRIESPGETLRDYRVGLEKPAEYGSYVGRVGDERVVAGWLIGAG